MATVRSEKTRRRKQRLPNLVGLQERDARLVLRHRGFFDPSLLGTPLEGEPYVEVRYAKSFAPFGTVVAQKPTRGQIVDSDARVELMVSMESLLDYLPALFRRREVDGTNFIENFLWIFQHVFHSIESKIDRMHEYFEVFETPEEFLPWLAGWVAFTLDGEWSEAERRLFLKRAVELYRIRGTPRGLRTFVELYTGVEPKIIENEWPLDGFQIGVASTIGVDSAILPPITRAHCFIVEVPLDPETVEDDQIIKLHQIISSEKPAHSTYYLRFTGEEKVLSRWTGPVIGAYMVGGPEMLTGEELAELERQAKAEAEAKKKE
jgi:phage tail-like protein